MSGVKTAGLKEVVGAAVYGKRAPGRRGPAGVTGAKPVGRGVAKEVGVVTGRANRAL